VSTHDDEFSRRYGSARRVKGGIRARTARGAFGTTWWAARWIAVLESFDIGGRLQRGRAYARRGQVISIEIKEGLVLASVQGSERAPYKVEVQVKTIPPEKWKLLAETSLRQIVIATKLLAGQMPESIEQLLLVSGVSLFPEKSGDLQTKCSCPDYSNPCKHIAAVYYLIGEEFDRDPFLLFRLRGMTKEKLLELIVGGIDPLPTAKSTAIKGKKTKKSQTAQATAAGSTLELTTSSGLPLGPPASSSLPPGTPSSSGLPLGPPASSALQASRGHRKTSAPVEEPLPSDPASFWHSGPAKPDLIKPANQPTTHGALLKRLGPIPFWRSEQNLMKVLAPLYARASDRALEFLATGDPSTQ